MSRFVESIKYLKGIHFNLEHHQARLNRTHRYFYPEATEINLSEVLASSPVPNDDQLYKCRVLYAETIQDVVYEPYHPRVINQYYLAVCPDEFDYSHKTLDRTFFENARKLLKADEDYIYVQNGRITDTSFANLVFTDGEKFFTPADTLLKGTKRALYLEMGLVIEEGITVKDLERFTALFAINAMIDLENSKPFPCDKLLLSHNQLKL
jgi:4-amino-4-deoxychorismate lyase